MTNYSALYKPTSDLINTMTPDEQNTLLHRYLGFVHEETKILNDLSWLAALTIEERRK